MIILYGTSNSKKQYSDAIRINKLLKDGKYNGYAYIIVARNPIPGDTRVLRIGHTAIGSRGLTTYRIARNYREWKQASGLQTNMLGKYYKREDCVVFIYPTKIPGEEAVLEAQMKVRHIKKYGQSPTFDRDINSSIRVNDFLVSNEKAADLTTFMK